MEMAMVGPDGDRPAPLPLRSPGHRFAIVAENNAETPRPPKHPRNPQDSLRARAMNKQFSRPRSRLKRSLGWIGGGAIALGAVGVVLFHPVSRQWLALRNVPLPPNPFVVDQPLGDEPDVLTLVKLPAEKRSAELQEVAAHGRNRLNRNRARYLLASDQIQEFEGGKALILLRGLENEYPLLAPTILLKQARAYELTNNLDQAQAHWQKILDRFPNEPEAAEALLNLGKNSEVYIEEAISRFPENPLVQDEMRRRLAQDPAQVDLMLALVEYAPDGVGIGDYQTRLQENHAAQLSPEEWELLADADWDQWQYGTSAALYGKAPATPRNLYRIARGLQLDAQEEAARQGYRSLYEKFPKAPETFQGLKHLASLLPATEALAYYDILLKNFPDQAGDVLLLKAQALEKSGDGRSAGLARKMLLEKYPDSDGAAKYRWQTAQTLANQGKLMDAWKWAKPIALKNPTSALAPKSVYWIGKWAQALNQEGEAAQAFKFVLKNYPESYYAWRSAIYLGWNVGSFTTVRELQPAIAIPDTKLQPPGGSPRFQELYQLGQINDAWLHFQTEVAHQEQLSVAEQFTEGLLKLSQGQYLHGINEIWGLSQRDRPEDVQAWQALRETPDYWYALFPLPYAEMVEKWSSDRQLNPLLVFSLMRQESRFQFDIKSPAGALGLMQVMPATGEWVANQINLEQYSLLEPEDNVILGTWYLDYTHREYNNNSMLAIASYNAGPGNVASWLKRFGFNDPDEFAKKIPFPETNNYVESVFSNYWNYLRLYNPEIQQKLANL